MIRPIWIYVSRITTESSAGMTSFGNPLVWWPGIVVTGVAIATPVWEKWGKKTAAPDSYIPIFLLIAYTAQFLPWVFVGRLTFIYHYFPSVPFVVLLITWFFRRFVKKPAIVYVYAGAVLVLFMFFYPVLSGWPMNPQFVRTFMAWLPGWVFIALLM